MSGFLVFDGISKSFGQVQAVDDVRLEINKGEFFSLLGPSGCGKTTLLRMVAGLEDPDRGRILLDGVDITELPPNRRRVNTIFQSYALFPHLDVWENIAFGLRVARRPRREIESEVERMLHLIQMEEHARKRPHQISGGQKQRVAVARALVTNPRLVLADEPTANLDHQTAYLVIDLMKKMRNELATTFIFSTHDPKIVGEAEIIHTLEDGLLKSSVNQGGESHA